MIAHLRGRLIAKHPNNIVVEASGVGYELNISVPTFSELPAAGAEVALHVYTHVREDALALYGFLRREEIKLCRAPNGSRVSVHFDFHISTSATPSGPANVVVFDKVHC